MNINDMYPSRYLKASDLKGQPATLTIAGVEMVLMEQNDGSSKEKPVLSFRGTERQMVLNVTNARMLAELFGPETDSWVGQQFVIASQRVSFGNRIVDAIRVMGKADRKAQPVAPPPIDDDDDIPF